MDWDSVGCRFLLRLSRVSCQDAVAVSGPVFVGPSGALFVSYRDQKPRQGEPTQTKRGY